MFDALDRDALNNGVFGIGVHNPYSSTGFVNTGQFPGISSTPSEIGYYTDANAGDQADTLDIKLDGPLSNATAKVSFFYQGEGQSGETLSYELYLNGVKVGGETITSENGLSLQQLGARIYTFALDGFTGDVHVFDEVKFFGCCADSSPDASDFLVESITGTLRRAYRTATGKITLLSGTCRTELNDVTTTDLFKALLRLAIRTVCQRLYSEAQVV